MPELPEVETVKKGIAPLLEGRRLIRVIQRRDKLRLPLPDNFAMRITGKRVMNITRRGKYLLLHLDDAETIICHLGMSGKMTIVLKADRDSPDIFAKHDHIIFETAVHDLVIYNDPRRFGLMTLCATDDLDRHRFFEKMGPEPLGNEFSGAYFKENIKHRRSPVKTLLLDQHLVAGLGNIYVCEALFLAEISPTRRANTLSPEEGEKLVPVIRRILRNAIEAGGSSLKDYARPDGDLGYFQHDFKVYGREGEACLKRGCGGIIKRINQSGRSTFYCPACQN